MTTLAAALILLATIALLRIAAYSVAFGLELFRTERRWRRAIREHQHDSTARRAARMNRPGTITE